MGTMRQMIVASCCLSALAGVACATVKPADVFSDHMVLQQGVPVPVWGTANPGEKLTVLLSLRGGDARSTQRRTVTADKEGKWRVVLDAMTASTTPHTMTIDPASTKQPIQIRDVLIGEVWLFSGQSNMQWTFSPSHHGVFNGEQEIAEGNWPLIRQNSFPRGRRGWVPITPEAMPEVSAIPYFFSRLLHQNLKVPIGILIRANGGTTVEQWSSPQALQQTDWGRKHMAFLASSQFKAYREAYMAYDKKRRVWAAAQKAGGTEPAPKLEIPPQVIYHNVKKTQGPSWFFHWCLEPVIGYAVRGAAWYQGESNSSPGNNERLFAYGEMLRAMITDWRQKWGRPLPFLIVQLPNKGTPSDYDPASRWAVLREEMRQVATTLPRTAMAVTIDTAHDRKLHSTHKKPVGERLAFQALHMVYDAQEIVPNGPIYESMTAADKHILLRFTSNGGEPVLVKPQPGQPSGFMIAAADRSFVPAQARIVRGGGSSGVQLMVWSDAVSEPMAVRYGWADCPPSTFYGGKGLPAAPFRTDNWTITELQRK